MEKKITSPPPPQIWLVRPSVYPVRSFPRNYNKEADAIAKATALLEPLPPDVFYETTTSKSAADEAAPPSL
jgi:hypothetical protein